jgi:signal transduction histidine kinase
MANLTAQIPAHAPEAPRNFWKDFTTPSPVLSIAGQQKARLLAAVTLVFIPLAAITVFISPTRTFLQTGTFTMPSPTLLIALAIIVFSYVISRTPYYWWGAITVIAVPYLAVGASVLASSTATTTTAYFFLSISVMLASLLMSARDTLIAGAIAIGLALVLMTVKPLPSGTVDLTVVSFILMMTGTTSLVSSIRDRNLRALETSQQELREQFIETERAREQAERSDKVKSAFLASMSHELRTPLNAIINFTRYVAKGSLGAVNEQQIETLNEVVDSARHLLNLINDVLDMSKIEAGSLKLFVEDNIELQPIVDSVASTGKSLLAEKPVTIQVEMADNLPKIRGDRQRIMQILLNIMSNACKFTEDGSIQVRTSLQNGDVVFAITDTGPGISTEDMASVFEAFKQTHSGLRQGGGTGLGMPISKNLAEAHGGRLWVESQPDKGATFFVALPVKSEALIPSITA